ncbi:hypothetical protein GGR50DRAFT_7191 [Xylaria sp. CBS 124048]|nr:hypothetical protein GGR50DRAFT_7191 [Xylaria sp. CBS 124048]
MDHPGPEKTRFCKNFRRDGKCKFGSRCKFSHDLENPTSQAVTTGSTRLAPRYASRANPNRLEEDDLREWKRLLRQAPRSPDRATCDRFFKLAVNMLGGDPGGLQEAVKLLADEDGLAYIRLLVEQHIPTAFTSASKQDIWTKQLKPLFTVVTHPRVADSAVLEQSVATIYSFMQGIGSRRMQIIFAFAVDVTNSAAIASDSTTTGSDASKLAIVEICLAVLSKMIDCNTSNIIDGSFKTIVRQLSLILKDFNNASDEYLILQSQKWIKYINLRLGVGDDLPASRAQAQRIGSRAEFTLPKNLPGHLSASGPRHDNDHADITRIKILPTRAEIVSSRAEYLPSNDPSSFHRPGIIGRLDREFRLLREDTIGQLRDVIRGMLEEIQSRKQPQRHGRQGLRANTYTDAELIDASFERVHGLDLLVRFRQPVMNTTRLRRREWWEQSNRLRPGALVCLISYDGSVLFCVVSESTMATGKDSRGNELPDAIDDVSDKTPSLADNREFAYVHLNLAEFRQDTLEQALNWYRNVGPRHQQCLAEFPGILLASFKHTLEALQKMSKSPSIPFVDLIAPETHHGGVAHIPPPQYATKPGFFFDLSCLSKDGMALRFSPDTKHLDPQVLAKRSTLDKTQSSAVLDGLSRCLALIQGPPGTGKSYTGEKMIKVLLENKAKANLGPILCITYTNHALDQLLEHLMDDGTTQIIRIGGRSKSERLVKVNLRVISTIAERTKSEKSTLWDTKNALISHESTISNSLQQLKTCFGLGALHNYLEKFHPRHHQVLLGTVIDEAGFQEVHHGPPNQRIDRWLNSGVAPQGNAALRPIEQLLTADLWSLNHGERHRLYEYWQKEIRDIIVEGMFFEYTVYTQTQNVRGGVLQEVNLRSLAAADVIGVTTTGLARNLDLLRRLGCKVLLCEEAGEVLEAHNLTALLPSLEHCILIGDQLQLRPQIQNYDLNSTNPRGAQYALDVSLFERLVSPTRDNQQRLPFSTLETQRRMHPSISELVRRTLYHSLEDGGSVAEYPKVLGVRKRLFWLQHTVPEDRAQDESPTSTSHTNSFEVDMAVALARHLVRQGAYGPDDIAVITPYLGQLYRLRSAMQTFFEISVGERDLEGLDVLDADKAARTQAVPLGATKIATRTTLLKSIRLATVDNFQGEEAKVVIISLVRSNPERRCGFLNTPNRINVLLSRAKHGMYLIGNSDTYGNVPMWAEVIAMLHEGGNIGPVLHLQCPRHPNDPIEMTRPDHFLQFSPEGGCNRPCDQRLPCGHKCINRCHAQIIHSAVKCLEQCPRLKKGCDHPCKLSCGDPCERKCTEMLMKLNIVLPCGHKKTTAQCWETQDVSSIVCTESTVKTVPGCEHSVRVPCFADVTAKSYRCPSFCGDPLVCGHSCHSECHRCKDRENGAVTSIHHEVCREPCNRGYTSCRHACETPCHGDEECPPCIKPCEVRCSHSKCSMRCSEPCPPCAEQTCSSACSHRHCTMPCAAPCNWVPCSRRCEKQLSCGHQCPSLCGEICPSEKYCQVCCDDENIKTAIVDLIMSTEYHEINLDEDPCIFPDCGHIMTKTSMDGVMDLKAHYKMTTSDSPDPIALSSSSTPFSMDEIKVCPTCRGSLRNIARYGRIIRRAALDEATKKFITWSNAEYLKLANQLVNIQSGLETAKEPEKQQRQQQQQQQIQIQRGRGQNVKRNSRLHALHTVENWIGDKTRYREAIQFYHRVTQFLRQVRKEEQPLQRVANFVRHASLLQKQKSASSGTGVQSDDDSSHDNNNNNNIFNDDESIPQMGGELRAMALLLKCEVVILSDFMSVRTQLLQGQGRPELKIELGPQMTECVKLVELAADAKYPREQVEGHVYFARFSAFARILSSSSSSSSPNSEGKEEKEETGNKTRKDDEEEKEAERMKAKELKTTALTHLSAARDLVSKYPPTHIFEREIEAVERLLRADGDNEVFYTRVSAEEMRAVYSAMAGEFLGTGHWYRCVNDHPFTIGECGMPMEVARCPECGATVGGTGHVAVEGVAHAGDIEALGRGVGRMGI